MSLEKYVNQDSIQLFSGPKYGALFNEIDLQTLGSDVYYALMSSFNDNDLFAEIHVYTNSGDYVGSTYDNTIIVDSSSNSFFVDVREVFLTLNIRKGSYKIAVNVIAPVFGTASQNGITPFFIQEISPSRTEIKLTVNNSISSIQLQQFRDYVFGMNSVSMLNSLIVNFGKNETYKILNIRFDERDQNVFYIKTYTPLSDSLSEYETGWFGIEVIDPYIDSITLASPKVSETAVRIAGPKFDIDLDTGQSSNATAYQAWNDLLDANATTAQSIIDNILSGSAQATLNIDYTRYENFIFYSRAQERIKNFFAKVEQLENYESEIAEIDNSSDTTLSAYSNTSKEVIQKRYDTLKSTFDPFERWLYYHETGSLFTHDITGSISPYPKYIENNQVVYRKTTDFETEIWYDDCLSAAIEYDETNYNSFWWSIPEHILMNRDNDQYVAFINMISQHFDTIWMYIKALTSIHERDEHPELGASNDLLFHIAKSYGWTLQDARSLSKLWNYKLGSDATGSLVSNSGLPTISHENQTKQIWRRIVNNLPYLLKTKGTSRSVKALMSIYGIPQTLLSIKEYGGPGLNIDKPIFTEDMFYYTLRLENGAYIEIPQDELSVYSYGWGDGSWCEGGNETTTKTTTPITYEFRFRLPSTGSMQLFAQVNNNQIQTAITAYSSTELGDGEIVSGSDVYGKIQYKVAGSNPQELYSKYLPIFDGDFWTIRLYDEGDSNVLHRVQIAKSSDCSYGEITHSDLIVADSNVINVDTVFLGRQIGLSSDFIGHIQNYREYYTLYNDDVFISHVLNPNAYHTNTPSGSYYSLYRYYPFGSDVQRYDITDGLIISSSHPDRSKNPSDGFYRDFIGDQYSQYDIINEKLFISVPTIGGNTIQSNKIRIESNVLKYDLSPETRSEFGQYDLASNDTNKVAIVFSQTDHVNRDIFNHMGFGNLDDWIGDPEYEFEDGYKLLRNKRNDYFQKYSQKNDINAFIRLLSLYDYTFFEQIKQLIPAKVDLISGVLIEPNILDRSKVQLSKRPKVTLPQWSDTITYDINETGKVDRLRGEIDLETHTEIVKDDVGPAVIDVIDEDVKFAYCYDEASIEDVFKIDCRYKGDVSGSTQVINPYDGHSGSAKTEIFNNRPNDRYRRKVCYYDAYPIQFSEIKNGNFYGKNISIFISGSNTGSFETGSVNTEICYSGSVAGICELIPDVNHWDIVSGSYTNSGLDLYSNPKELFRFRHAILLRANDGIYSGSIEQTYELEVTGSSFIRIFASITDSIEPATLEITLNDLIYDVVDTEAYFDDGNNWIRELRIPYDTTPNNKIKITNLTDENIYIYSVESHPIRNRWEEGWLRNSYRYYNIPANCILEDSDYQIDEDMSYNKSRFVGSKLSGAGVNIDSPDTIDGGPVVTIRKTNPNNISTNFPSTEGNLRLD